MATMVALLVAVSIVAMLPQNLALLRGERLGGAGVEEHGLGLRWLREATYLSILGLWSVLAMRSRRPLITGAGILLSSLAGAWAVIVVLYSVWQRDLPFLLALTGLRAYQYLPIALIGFWAVAVNDRPIVRFAQLLRFYIVVQAAFSVYQVVTEAGYVWQRTLLGGRAFGTFTYFNEFSSMLAIAAVAFYMGNMAERSRRFTLWIWACAALAFASGSRAGAVVAVLVALRASLEGRKYRMRIPAMFWFIVLPLLVVAFSHGSITGRTTELTEEGRLDIWAHAYASFKSDPMASLVGTGLGLAATSAVSLFGENAFPGQVGNVHNQFLSLLMGFGVPGVVLAILALVAFVRGAETRYAIPVLLTFLALGLTFTVLEFFPFNVIVFFLMGTAAGAGCREWRRRAEQSALPSPSVRRLPEAGTA